MDIRSTTMTIKTLMATIKLENGQILIKNWPNETVINVEEISGVNFVEPGLVVGNGYLHIATFTNSAPPNNRFSAGSHPQCFVFSNRHTSAVQNLFRMIQTYLNDNPPASRHPNGELLAESAMKLDVLPQKTRKVYDEQVGDHNVRFVIMGIHGQAIITLSERLVIVKAGLMAGATGGGRATSFRYADIIALEINTGWVTSVIEIITAGHTGTPQHDFWAIGRDRDPRKLSNTLPLTKELLEKQKEYIDVLRGLIDEAKSCSAPTTGPAVDIVKQLRDLADLKEKGILSVEEFEQAKKRLLNPAS